MRSNKQLMNVFYLDENPRRAARYHCDRHVVKMVIESAQMLSTAHRVLGNDDECLYRSTHVNHPSTAWARSSNENYAWLYLLFRYLSGQYRIRYGKEHLSWTKLGNILINQPKNIPIIPFSPPPQCMPKEYKNENTVTAYRAFYIGEKSHFATWKTTIPYWFNSSKNE